MNREHESYGLYDHLADRVIRPLPELMRETNEFINGQTEIDSITYRDWALEAGIAVHTALAEELAEKQTAVEVGDSLPVNTVIHAISFTLAAKLRSGELSLKSALALVEEEITDPEHVNSFKSSIYGHQSLHESEEGNKKLALKAARKATDHAHKSGVPDNIFLSLHKEAFCLLELGDYANMLVKLKKMHDMLDAETGLTEYTTSHVWKQQVLLLTRKGHVALGQYEEAARIQDKMFELGYESKTGEQYINEELPLDLALDALSKVVGDMYRKMFGG
jgi:tetratricopeptide (TPR) repeat protein